jgi:choline dehydrogenase-like flavoprotein
VWDELHAKPPRNQRERDGFTVYPVLLHPRSKGTVRLRSNNPDDSPLINPNYFSEDADVKYMAEGEWGLLSLL